MSMASHWWMPILSMLDNADLGRDSGQRRSNWRLLSLLFCSGKENIFPVLLKKCSKSAQSAQCALSAQSAQLKFVFHTGTTGLAKRRHATSSISDIVTPWAAHCSYKFGFKKILVIKIKVIQIEVSKIEVIKIKVIKIEVIKWKSSKLKSFKLKSTKILYWLTPPPPNPCKM